MLEIQQTASASDGGVNEVNGEDDSGSMGKPSRFALYSGGKPRIPRLVSYRTSCVQPHLSILQPMYLAACHLELCLNVSLK